MTKLSAEVGTRKRVKGDVFINRGLTENLAFNFNAGYNQRGGLGEFINLPEAKYDVGENREFHGRVSVNMMRLKI